MKKIKAVALYSGGLDSILAIKIIAAQGIEVEAIQFITPFFGYDKKEQKTENEKKAFDDYGINLKIIDITPEYIEMLKCPRYGYGKNFNPCVDCKIMLFNHAHKYMKESGASFLITGEVIGQRPMSQRKDTLRIVERDSKCDGILLRPLCAKKLKPTLPEEEGIVDRDKLFDFSGRTRKPQIALAELLGIKDYPTPAGGCILTDPQLAKRIKRRYSEDRPITVNDILLLRLGRHFELKENYHLVVGKNFQENQEITKLWQEGDVIFKALDFPGPTSLLRGNGFDEEATMTTASITARYSDGKRSGRVKVGFGKKIDQVDDFKMVASIDEEKLDKLRY